MYKIIELLAQVGVGSVFGVIIGMAFQYLISKKLKVFETKLIIFRRVYKQLYYFVLMNQEEITALDDNESSIGISAEKLVAASGLDLKKDLGDVLYYVDGDLEKRIGTLIYNIYQEGAVINKKDIDDILGIMDILKKLKK